MIIQKITRIFKAVFQSILNNQHGFQEGLQKIKRRGEGIELIGNRDKKNIIFFI